MISWDRGKNGWEVKIYEFLKWTTQNLAVVLLKKWYMILCRWWNWNFPVCFTMEIQLLGTMWLGLEGSWIMSAMPQTKKLFTESWIQCSSIYVWVVSIESIKMMGETLVDKTMIGLNVANFKLFYTVIHVSRQEIATKWWWLDSGNPPKNARTIQVWRL